MQDCGISIANALEILQSCTEPSVCNWCQRGTHRCENTGADQSLVNIGTCKAKTRTNLKYMCKYNSIRITRMYLRKSTNRNTIKCHSTSARHICRKRYVRTFSIWSLVFLFTSKLFMGLEQIIVFTINVHVRHELQVFVTTYMPHLCWCNHNSMS